MRGKQIPDIARQHPKEYRAWLAMKYRCVAKRGTAARYYSSRGIKVHPDWQNSFEAFLSSVGISPSPDYFLDRINPNGNYEPGNVRWATKEIHLSNKLHHHFQSRPNGLLREILKEARSQLNISQITASKLIGVSLATLSQIEQGLEPGDRVLAKITAWLDKESGLNLQSNPKPIPSEGEKR